MTIIKSLQKRFSGGDARVGAAETSRSDDTQVPIPGYDRFNDRDLMAELSKHSQAELAAVDTYEHSHKDRPVVFNKLRYLRGQQPLEDYDTLSVKEILAKLEGTDMAMLQSVRVYERKFQHRPDVLDEVATAIRERLPARGG
jgi:hypothetical protein